MFLNSLAGESVHLVTVNDYLARRDAEWMGPIYDMLGVRVGVIQNMQCFGRAPLAYAADVTYGTNSEFGFDYLRDNMAGSLEEVVQRGHPFGIVDEVDNILIDEARTPLIISGAPEEAGDLLPPVRAARADAEGRAEDGREVEARQRRAPSPTTTTSSTRSTRPSRRPSAASTRSRSSSASRTSTSPSTATSSTT